VGSIPLPADQRTFERFLARTATGGSETNFVAMAAAVGWCPMVTGFTFPAANSRVAAIMAGARRVITEKRMRKSSMSIELVRGIVDCCDIELRSQSSDCRISSQAISFFALVAFFALLRFSDIVTLRLQHFSFISDHTIITVPYSKCDQYRRDGNVS
jgi:hypothetical protein